MIVRWRPTASYAVSGAMLAAAPAGELERVVRERLDGEMDAWALAHAVDVRMLDRVYLDWQTPHGWTFEVSWSPDPRRGCEFRSGPADGSVWALPFGGSHRLPPPQHVLPPLAAPLPEVALAAVPAAVSLLHLRYRRAGIDPALHCWVYEYET